MKKIEWYKVKRVFGVIFLLSIIGLFVCKISNEPKKSKEFTKIEFTNYEFRIDDDSELHYHGNLINYGFKSDYDVNIGYDIDIVRINGDKAYLVFKELTEYNDNGNIVSKSILGSAKAAYIPLSYKIITFDD